MEETPMAVAEGSEQATSTQDTQADQATATQESFTDLRVDELPPELQEKYKSMQADYTKKTQGLSERAKEYEAFQAKAIAFDELMSNPQFSKFTETLQAPQQQEVPLTGTDLIAQIQENPEILKDLIRQEAQRLYGPLADRYYGDLAAKEIDSLRSKYSDFTEYEDGIADILSKDQSGVLTAEQAYKMLAFDKAKQAGINEGVKSVEQRKLGAAPQASSAAVQPSQRVSSILEAFNRARASEN